MIDNLDERKSGTFGEIPTNCLNGVSNISVKFLHTVWNDEVLKDWKFLIELKLAHVLAFQKEDSALVENYRPTSLSPIFSQIFEIFVLNQITTYMNEYLFPYFVDTKRF